MLRCPTAAFVSALTIAACAVPTATASASNSSLPAVPSGARPGPALLYAPAATAPQLQNAGPWKAPPILVSGAEAYTRGEFLYQDFLYDDDGGAGTPDPSDPFNAVANLFSPKTGTLTYPTDTAKYGNNAADLVEFRVKPLRAATAFRVTLNTMLDPSVAAFTVAIGDSPQEHAWPFGAGVSSPAKYFLTVHGGTAVLTNAATGAKLEPAPAVTVDQVRRQIQVLVAALRLESPPLDRPHVDGHRPLGSRRGHVPEAGRRRRAATQPGGAQRERRGDLQPRVPHARARAGDLPARDREHDRRGRGAGKGGRIVVARA